MKLYLNLRVCAAVNSFFSWTSLTPARSTTAKDAVNNWWSWPQRSCVQGCNMARCFHAWRSISVMCCCCCCCWWWCPVLTAEQQLDHSLMPLLHLRGYEQPWLLPCRQPASLHTGNRFLLLYVCKCVCLCASLYLLHTEYQQTHPTSKDRTCLG